MVFLTNGDLDFFDLSPESFGPKSEELHRFLFVLMETVRDETGFDPFEGQVVVEASRTKDGVHLSICRTAAETGYASGRRISRDEFRKAKGVRVKGVSVPRMPVGHIASEEEEYLRMLDEKRHARMRTRKKKRGSSLVLVFSSYTDMESGLCLISAEDIAGGELYRSGKRYAVILGAKALDSCFGILEFTESHFKNDIAADRVRECWSLVAKGEELSEMAEALKNMI